MRPRRRVSIMRLKKYPQCLQEFGWCDILSVVYVAQFPMTRSQKQVALLFEDVKVALNISSNIWMSGKKQNRDSINFNHIVKLLIYYQYD